MENKSGAAMHRFFVAVGAKRPGASNTNYETSHSDASPLR